MGSRLNVRCVKTPSEEGGTIPVLGKGTSFEDPLDSEEGQWSSAGLVNSTSFFFFFFFYCLLQCGSCCRDNRHSGVSKGSTSDST